jgi:methyl-accepting chemotaxis protein
MFPSSFNARVAERMAIWGAMLAFLAFLYAAIAVIQVWKLGRLSDDARYASAALLADAKAAAAVAHIAAAIAGGPSRDLVPAFEAVDASLKAVPDAIRDSAVTAGIAAIKDRLSEVRAAIERSDRVGAEKALAAVTEKRAEIGKRIAQAIEEISGAQASFLASDRQNKMLIALLAVFVLGQILILEYRWLMRPIIRMASLLQTAKCSSRELSGYAVRRDEIGTFARALMSHFELMNRQQEAATEQQARLSERLSRQELFKRESLAFQSSIGEIVLRLEAHAGRMSAASSNLIGISSEADVHAGASVQSTQRASNHVDLVAASIRDIAGALASVAGEAEGTSQVAAAARSQVEAARNDAKQLMDSAHTIEPVVRLIEDVASQTNLLALNATIEAARAGELGRGFAVVANEVKQLAARTAHATEEVRGGLQGITASSGRIVERVERLVESIEQVDAVAAAIAGSMRQQDSTSQAITSNTEKAAGDVREVAATVKQVAAMIGEAKRASDLVTKVSNDLELQAADLRNIVERFVETTEGIAA